MRTTFTAGFKDYDTANEGAPIVRRKSSKVCCVIAIEWSVSARSASHHDYRTEEQFRRPRGAARGRARIPDLSPDGAREARRGPGVATPVFAEGAAGKPAAARRRRVCEGGRRRSAGPMESGQDGPAKRSELHARARADAGFYGSAGGGGPGGDARCHARHGRRPEENQSPAARGPGD